MSIKFINIPISVKKKTQQKMVSIFSFLKGFVHNCYWWCEKRTIPLVKNVTPPSDSSQLPRDPQHGQQGEVDDHGHLSESECV